MASGAIPDEIHRHIEAVLVLSKRDVLLRVLGEADLCLDFGNLTAAAAIAGVALEEASLLVIPDPVDGRELHLEAWREMRNRAAHLSPDRIELDKEEIRAMLAGVRQLLKQIDKPQGGSAPSWSVEDAITKTRGKYAFVRTSVDEFLQRKHDDWELEAQK